jgi:preprotein translocase subunit SecE
MRFIKYLQEVKNELVYKVTWPSWPELQDSAIVVMVASVLIAISVFLMDFIFGINQGMNLWKGILGFVYSLI